MCVCFLKILVWNSLSFRLTKTSKNGSSPACSTSIVNWMLLLMELRWFRKSSSPFCPCLQITKVSSTYLNQREGWFVAVLMARSSKCSMNMLAMTGERGDPIAAPSSVGRNCLCIENTWWLGTFLAGQK